MLPFVSQKLPLVIHADEKRQISSALDWAEKRKYKIIISGGRDAWKIAERISSMEIAVIYRHVFTAPNQLNLPFDTQFRAPGILKMLEYAFPLDLDLEHGRQLIKETYRIMPVMRFHLAYKEKDALASITLNPAKNFGLDHMLGTLEKGKKPLLLRVQEIYLICEPQLSI